MRDIKMHLLAILLIIFSFTYAWFCKIQDSKLEKLKDACLEREGMWSTINNKSRCIEVEIDKDGTRRYNHDSTTSN